CFGPAGTVAPSMGGVAQFRVLTGQKDAFHLHVIKESRAVGILRYCARWPQELVHPTLRRSPLNGTLCATSFSNRCVPLRRRAPCLRSTADRADKNPSHPDGAAETKDHAIDSWAWAFPRLSYPFS